MHFYYWSVTAGRLMMMIRIRAGVAGDDLILRWRGRRNRHENSPFPKYSGASGRDHTSQYFPGAMSTKLMIRILNY
jgi:hypothetical protein